MILIYDREDKILHGMVKTLYAQGNPLLRYRVSNTGLSIFILLRIVQLRAWLWKGKCQNSHENLFFEAESDENT